VDESASAIVPLDAATGVSLLPALFLIPRIDNPRSISAKGNYDFSSRAVVIFL
jgi:hypothetical protein